MALTYSVYRNPDALDPVTSTEFVLEKFSLLAFLFTGLWLLYHRLWLPLAIVVTLRVGMEVLAWHGWLSENSVLIMQLLISLYLGLAAADLRASRLERKGYALDGVVTARDLLSAEQRYFDAKLAG